MLPPVTSCQLPLTTHISFLSPNSGLFRIFCFNWFCATFLLFPAAADICQPLSSCQREFATPVLFCFRICFPHICFPDDRRPTQRWLLPFLWPLSFFLTSRHPLIAISNLFICTQNLNNHPPIHSVSPWNICRCCAPPSICRRNVFANAPDVFDVFETTLAIFFSPVMHMGY